MIDYEDRQFPRYLFVETEKLNELAAVPRTIYVLTKLFGVKDDYGIHYTPFCDEEADLIDRLLNRKNKKGNK